MPEEAIGDLVGGLAEVGVSVLGSSNNNKKTKYGCLLFALFGLILCLGIYFGFFPLEKKEIRGLITKKLPNDKMVIKTEKGEDIHTINHELYLNKQEGDSIILK